MKAIDTNILARFFIDDPDDEQAVKAKGLEGIVVELI